MKTVSFLATLCLCLLTASHVNAQTEQRTFLKLTDAAGTTIKGTSTQRFFEGQIIVNNLSAVVTGNPKLQFTMPVSSASAALVNLQGGKQKLKYAVFSIIQLTGWGSGHELVYTVRLEDIAVLQVIETPTGTTVNLQASRIGTTHYQSDRKLGIRTVSGKSGYDFINKTSWTNF